MKNKPASRNRKNRSPAPTLTILLALVLLPVTITTPALAQDTADPQQISDKDITFAVESDLVLSDAVPAHMIDIETTDGIVTLSGTVSNYLARERATEIARSIKGVRAVVNDIVVVPVGRTDEQIQADVEAALATDPATDEYDIEVLVENNTAAMQGTVHSWAEKQLAGDVAGGVKGVMAVENELGIVYEEDRSDRQIRDDAVRRLQADVWVRDAAVEVAVENDTVILSGAVGSATEKARAIADAWVLGTDEVVADDLAVKWWAADRMRRPTKHAQVSDSAIEEAVHDAFLYDPRVSPFDLSVSVDRGQVTLSGEVDNLVAKVAAGNDARNTLGVWRVNNYVHVRPGDLPDGDELEQRVRKALARDPYVELFQIDVDAVNGRVFLYGTVNTSFEKEHAARVAWRVNGVADVANNLEYRHEWSNKADYELLQDVRDQLRWDPVVEASEVTVTVEGGVVELAGTVDTWQERLSAERNAYEADPRDVRNRLKVDENMPYPDYIIP